MVQYLYVYTHVRNYITPEQYEFIGKHSTPTNLAYFSQFLAEAMHNKFQVDVIYNDFAKAFDIITANLQLFVFYGNILNLMRSYLCDRSQYVYYNGYSSCLYNVLSDIPQGVNVGPLLFV